MTDLLTKFLPIAKIDEEKHMVWGLASDETPDAEEEITDYAATKAAVAEWQAWSNIREMHGPSAVGVAQEIVLDDATKSLWIGVKVVDEAAWRKVKEGVYKGFSIGGKALRKVAEVVNGRLVRRIVDYILIEISLVDRPANPSARFSLVKREGGLEMPKKTEEQTPPSQADGQQVDPAAKNETPAAGELMAKMDGEQTPPAEGEKPEPEEGEKMEGEASGEEPETAMTSETVKGIVLQMLKEIGLVREQGEGFAQAAEVADLRKSIGGLAPADELTKVAGNLTKVVGDIAKVAGAIEELSDRLEKVEQLPQGTGPVLRELSFGAVADQTETVLKSLLADATDPQMREAIGQRLTQIQIKTAHQQRNS